MTPQNDWSFINWDEKQRASGAVASTAGVISCTKCKGALPSQWVNIPGFNRCPHCNTELMVEVFPALFRAPEKGSVGEALVVDTHASCFYHPQKQAATVCATCGKFVCSLCDVEVEGQHLCPPCLESSQKQGKLKSLENRRTLHETIALHLSFLSILIFYISFITGPLALYWAIKHRKTPSSLVRNTKLSWFLAVFLSSLITLAWIVVIVFLIVVNPFKAR
jgi:hypothetical protein